MRCRFASGLMYGSFGYHVEDLICYPILEEELQVTVAEYLIEL